MHLVSVHLNISLLRSVIVVWHTLNLGLDLLEAQKPKLNIVFAIPTNATEAYASRTAPAIIVALNSVTASKQLSDFKIDWQLIDAPCSAGLMARKFLSVWKNAEKTVHAIFGGYCWQVCQLLANISKSLNIPFLAVGCTYTRKRNHRFNPTYLSMEAWQPAVLPVISALFQTNNWTRLAILATSDSNYLDLAERMKRDMEARNWTAILTVTILDKAEKLQNEKFETEIELVLKAIKKQARVVFFAMSNINMQRFLIVAQKIGMYNGEFAFIGYLFHHVDPPTIGATNDEVRTTNVGLLLFKVLDNYTNLENGRFVDLINDDKTRNNKKLIGLEHLMLETRDSLDIRYAGDLYTAIRFYSFLLNNTLTSNQNVSTDPSTLAKSVAADGILVMSRVYELSIAAAQNASIDEALGTPLFDKKGNRVVAWSLLNSDEFNKEKIIMNYSPVGGSTNESIQLPEMNLIWPGKSTKVPLDVPKCGWENEKCFNELHLFLICTCFILGFLVLAGAFAFFLVTRRMKTEVERKTLEEWQVKWSHVVVIGDNVVGRLSTHDAHRSKTSVEVGSQADQSDIRSSHRSTTNRLYTLAGTYKGKTVAIKKILRDSVDIFHPAIFSEVKQMFYIHHENVNPFFGVCAQAPNVCVLMLYADRGSLQDVLAETKYEINWEFRLCLATDVAKGMEYLHDSPVGPHGHLTSSNCVVDSKWQCKITDYGLKQFKRSYNPDISTFKWNSDLLWTAPEILNKPDTNQIRIYGTKEGDVYSFGMIASELITKELPFHNELDSITPEDVVTKLKIDPLYRPALPPPEGSIGASWNSLAVLCWHRKPEVRPSFKTIRVKLKVIHGGKTPNLMQRMQQMMEDAVERKTADIAVEKKRTETVIYSLLPKSVADQLSVGKEIRPQRTESVTLCYCETTDLYASAKALSPIQMTELLKSLFRFYDDVIKRYNVVEVNSRGSKDSMLLGSGFPQYTKKHAEDICNLSLDLISEALMFKTPLASKLDLSLKITVHSGPVLTAVIWRMLPRYCVNGDALQTIMAMHSSSKAMRVRISEATHAHIKQTGGFTVGQGGKVAIKGATPMRTYWLTGKTGYRKPLPASIKRRSSSLANETED